MANVGRFVCVFLPFAMTAAALVALLIAALSGVTNKGLYMFRVNLTNFSVSTDSLTEILTSELTSRDLNARTDLSSLISSIESATSSSSSSISSIIDSLTSSGSDGNITAEDLGLANIYDVSVWGYCATYSNGTKKCTSPEFNWAAKHINITEIESIANSTTDTVETISKALKTFVKVSKWTEVVFIIAIISLAADLLLGVFATCSRIVSCFAWIMATLASITVGAAAILSTVIASVVVAAIKSSVKVYGAKSSWNTSFLTAVWLAVVFCFGAGIFWIFTVCCCKPTSSKKSRGMSGEKYESIGPQYASGANQGYSGFPGGQQKQHSGTAYEPYSHRV